MASISSESIDCRYFEDLKSMLEWSGSDRLQQSRSPLRRRHRFANSLTESKFMIAHDYCGGYKHLEDRNAQGYFPHPTGYAFWVRGFSLADTYLYFSHSRVAIPPISWTNACHKSGVKCLGTLICEWEESVPDARLLLTKNESGVGYLYADALTNLAVYFRFDGYLINMETVMDDAKQATELLDFVAYFKYAMHRALGPETQVIWYDSLTTYNQLDYQNCLNKTTYPWILASDGLFTNYSWTFDQTAESARQAGPMLKRSLWTGVDVWGRNVTYDHKWNIGKTLRKLAPIGTSVVMFAPVWDYEELGEANFEKNDHELWFTRRDPDSNEDVSISRAIRPLPAPVLDTPDLQLFYTSFSTGHGSSFFVNGKSEYDKVWVHRSIQTALPSYMTSSSFYAQQYLQKLYAAGVMTVAPDSYKYSWTISYDYGFYGGSCMKFTFDPYNRSPYHDILFSNSRPAVFESTEVLSTSPTHKSNSIAIQNRLLRRPSSMQQIAVDGVFIAPLFLIDFCLEAREMFSIDVTFLKVHKGDVRVRLSGNWIVEYERPDDSLNDYGGVFESQSVVSPCFDELPTDPAKNVFDALSFDADISGSVLGTWVRKSVSFQIEEPPQSVVAACTVRSRRKLVPRFRINHIDMSCSKNFTGTLYLGALSLYNSRRSKEQEATATPSVMQAEVITPSIPAPVRVTSVSLVDNPDKPKSKTIAWANDDNAAEWLVYIDGVFVGVATNSGWLVSVKKHDKSDSDEDKEAEGAPVIHELITKTTAVADDDDAASSDSSGSSVFVALVRIDVVGLGGSIVKGVELPLEFECTP
ncbi:glycosyl hydrolase family 85-domain-containing protein [Limtongia smithiae]|uniref:glycosyl hydrolase family 85-domain-containing protein n=1 Tax=Limtongia smithiae TaxID=1125753 RepID=UPI0034CFB38A